MPELAADQRVQVRPVRVSDAPAVIDLIEALGYDTDSAEVPERLEWFVESGHDHVLVAESEGVVRGAVVLSLTRRFVEPGWFSRITALVVDPSGRRLGVGRALLHEAERIAADAGSTLMQINCGRRVEREAAHEFYRAMGYEIDTTITSSTTRACIPSG